MRSFRPVARSGVILLVLLAGAGPTLAQSPAAAPDGPAPSDPAEAPPSPARLPPMADGVARPADTPPMALPPGMEASPEGRWRIRFAGDSPSLAAPAATALTTLGRRLATVPEGRITIEAQASGPAADVSIARRLSLARGLAVKQALAEGGLPPTRIDIRAMGRTAEAADAADVLPPRARPATPSPAPAPAPAPAPLGPPRGTP